MSGTESGETEDGVRHAVVLDVLPHGRPDDDRPQYQKPPLGYALGEMDFRLLEIELVEDAEASIGDRLVVAPPEEADLIARATAVEHDDLSNAARSELEYLVGDIVEADEKRFVDFFNDAQPITLRLHQLNLLPGIGKKLRNNVLDERKREPFETFEELTERVSGLHDPRGAVVDRIIEEIREEDLKYRTFARRDDGAE